MSHDNSSDKPKETKAELHVLQHRRRSTDHPESNAAVDAVESNRLDLKNYDPTPKRESMRGWVTVIIVGVFGVCILSMVAAGIGATLWHATSLKDVNEGFGSIGAMLSSHVVPIITLVLGFYFGSERK